MSITTAASALQAFATGMQVTANNIANMNTPGFQAGSAVLAESAPPGGVGVVDVQQRTANAGYIQTLQPVEHPDTGQLAMEWQTVEASNTDLAREMVDMIAWQRGFEASAAVIRTYDDMNGVLLNMVV